MYASMLVILDQPLTANLKLPQSNILWTLNVFVYCSSAKSESEGLLPDYRNDVKGLNWERRQIKFAAFATKYFQGASLSH